MNVLSRDEIEACVKCLLKKYHADYALLFGSYARNEANAESDIDILVVGGCNFRSKDIFSFGEELREMTHKEADVFELRELNVDTPFYNQVMKEGIRIA